jgi:hypothetical protein
MAVPKFQAILNLEDKTIDKILDQFCSQDWCVVECSRVFLLEQDSEEGITLRRNADNCWPIYTT